MSGAIPRPFLIDIGANLGHPSFSKDYAEVLDRAKNAGVRKIMITGVNRESVLTASELASKSPGFLYYTAGFHPHDAKEFNSESLSFLESHLNNPQCVSAGECGLDFNRNFSPREQQLHAFDKQVELACRLNKPLFIHERESHKEMVEILSKYSSGLPPAVIHCFTGTVEEAKKYVDMGLYIGLTGYIWKDRSDNGIRYALKSRILPIDRILIETDAPFMYPKINDKKIPSDIRGQFSSHATEFHKFSTFQRNEPSSLPAICELIAFFSDENPQTVAEKTTKNALEIYGLSDGAAKN